MCVRACLRERKIEREREREREQLSEFVNFCLPVWVCAGVYL